MNCASRFAASALLVLGACPAAAQERRPGELPDPWLVRARAVSDDLTADAPPLALHDRALLRARLGEVWWKDDERRARSLMLKAVEEVEAAPEQEEAGARARRLEAARALLSSVGARDRNLGERLSAVLAAKPKAGEAPDYEREQNAQALADAALEVLDADPRRAAELGAASLRAGVSSTQGVLLTRLHGKDAALAVSLFREGLAAARAARGEGLWWVLAGAAFPHRLYFPPFSGPVFGEEVRAATLRLLAETLLRPAASEEDEKKVCSYAWAAAPLIEDFGALLPQQAPAARIVINRCQQKMSAASRNYLDGEMAERKPKTADDYLRAAADADDERMRNLYLGRAAYVSYSEEGEPDRAIEIIEGWDSRLREEKREVWESWRWMFAAASALKHFKAGDRQTVRRVLDAVPPKLRAFALVDFLRNLAESKPRDFPAEMLGETRSLLSKYEGPEAGEHSWLALVRLYAAYLPADAPLVFGEAVASLNRQARSRPDTAAVAGVGASEYPWQAVALPVALVEADEPGVTSAVAALDDRLTRARVRLGLLGALLEKRRAELRPAQPGRKQGAGAGRRPAP